VAKTAHPSQTSFTFRIDAGLKKQFQNAADKENKTVAQVLRDFMLAYVDRRKRREFEVEARRQSALIANSSEEDRIMDWISDVTDREGWR
jgi:predicted transcriptional regulator